VRLSLADLRERKYEATGRDNYLFRVDDKWVVDATLQGGTARFINHSCEPNCATRVVSIDGINRIAIFSKREIAIGEELCYDYMV
jgi:SET domain-containing protein